MSAKEISDVRVLCATRSHTRTMRISVSDEESDDCRISWEWVEAIPAPQAPDQTTGEKK
jgi:hypothetical protein